MAPLRDYLCSYCGHQFEVFTMAKDKEDWAFAECRCESQAEVLPGLIGGYNGSTGSSSTRPKGSTSMPKAKVFTKHPFNTGEPDGEPPKEPTADEPEQLEFEFNK